MAQVALSLVTLVGAGLFLRSLQNAQRTDPGFDTSHLLLLSFDAGAEGYSGEASEAFQRTVLERVRAVPDVKGAVLAQTGLFNGGLSRTVFPEGVDPNDRRNGRLTPLNQVGPGYFETVGIPILRGRALAETDRANAPMVAVVNETMARRLWPDQEAIGKRFRCFGQDWIIEVVGVARDAKYVTIGEDPQAFFYLPLAQHPSEAGHPARAHGRRSRRRPWARCAGRCNRSTRACRSPTSSPSASSSTRRCGRRACPPACSPPSAPGPPAGRHRRARRRVVFGGGADAGVRHPHGHGRTARGHVAHGDPQTLVTASVGAAFALVVAYAATRSGLGNLLIGVRAGDPVTFGGTLVVILAAALAASAWPAWRASRIDPLVALRYD
jgi:hypothetical protein